jgi:hypothetical protein
VKFTVTKSEPGIYSVDIDGNEASFTILGAVGAAATPVNAGLVITLIVGILILASVLVLILAFRRSD